MQYIGKSGSELTNYFVFTKQAMYGAGREKAGRFVATGVAGALALPGKWSVGGEGRGFVASEVAIWGACRFIFVPPWLCWAMSCRLGRAVFFKKQAVTRQVYVRILGAVALLSLCWAAPLS